MGNMFWAFKKKLSICYDIWKRLQKLKKTCLRILYEHTYENA
jgi:hypothetical protein